MDNVTHKSKVSPLKDLKEYIARADNASNLALFEHFEESMGNSLRLRGSSTKVKIETAWLNDDVSTVDDMLAIEITFLGITFTRGSEKDSFDLILTVKDLGTGQYTASTEIVYKDLYQKSDVTLSQLDQELKGDLFPTGSKILSISWTEWPREWTISSF